jgi:[ribosomal protein S18]-alanine N-acetyltransferase
MATIAAAVSLSPWPEERLLAACIDERTTGPVVRVIEEAGEVLGFVVYARVLDEVTVLEIAVCAESQGRGLGQALLCSALQEMRRVGAVRCLLEVRESNQLARRLYQRNGFSIDGTRKQYYTCADGREDALLMSAPL